MVASASKFLQGGFTYSKFRQVGLQTFFSFFHKTAQRCLQHPWENFNLMAGSWHTRDLSLITSIRNQLKESKQDNFNSLFSQSASGQYPVNAAIWLVRGAGRIFQSCPRSMESGLMSRVPIKIWKTMLQVRIYQLYWEKLHLQSRIQPRPPAQISLYGLPGW